MPDDTAGRQLTRAQQFDLQLNEQVRNFAVMLPQHISVEKFKRVVVTAVMQSPELFHADRKSFFMAAQKCASDGLLPDGREAVLLPFNTKVKVTLPDGTRQDQWIAAVTYIPMIQGIRTRMRNTGLVASAEAYVVHRNDKFFQKFGSDPQIVHEPPQLGSPRGDAVGAYAIIRLKSGEVIQEVMDRDEIERVRSFSKAKDGPAWRDHWGEMARKTVLRRVAKAAPTSAEMLELLGRDDEPPELPPLAELPAIEAEPPRRIAGEPVPDDPRPLSFVIVDTDGEEHEFTDPAHVEEALLAVFTDASQRGRSALDAAAENNRATLTALRNANHGDMATRIAARWRELVAGLEQAARSSAKKRPGEDRANEDAPAKHPCQGDPSRLHRALDQLAAFDDDLLGDRDWKHYADRALALIEGATPAEAQAVRTSELPVMQELKRTDGDLWRRIADALAAKGKE